MGVELIPEGRVGCMQIIFGFGGFLCLVSLSHSPFLEKKLMVSISRLVQVSSNVWKVTLQNGTSRGLVKLSCLFAQIFLPNLKVKELNIFISDASVVTRPSCWPSAWWGANLWISFYSLTWKLEREASAWSSGSFIYCLHFFSCHGSFPVLYNPGNWPGMDFRVSNDPLLNDISVKDTTSLCLEFVSDEHILVFQSGFQILIFCLLLFTTIQMPWKSKGSNPQG